VCDFTTVFENALGGRVAVVPLDVRDALGPAFLQPYRREHLVAILRWLAREKLPAAVGGGVHPLAYRMDLPDRVMLGVFNLSHDDWAEMVWDVHVPMGVPSAIEALDAAGTWRDAHAQCEPISADVVRLTVPGPLSFRRPMILALRLG